MSLLDELGVDEEDFTWQDLALCKETIPSRDEDGQVTDWFFDTYESSVKDAIQVDAMCLSCPVMRDCLLTGTKNKEQGVWGGVYLTNGKKDKNRNAHKTDAVWSAIQKRVSA